MMKILTYSDYVRMKPFYSMEDAAKLMDAHVDALWDALVKNGIYPSCTACGYAIVWKNELRKLSGILYNEKNPELRRIVNPNKNRNIVEF